MLSNERVCPLAGPRRYRMESDFIEGLDPMDTQVSVAPYRHLAGIADSSMALDLTASGGVPVNCKHLRASSSGAK